MKTTAFTLTCSLFLCGCVDYEAAVYRNHGEFVPDNCKIDIRIYDTDAAIYLVKISRASCPTLDKQWYVDRLTSDTTVLVNTSSTLGLARYTRPHPTYHYLGFANPDWIVYLEGDIDTQMETKYWEDVLQDEFPRLNREKELPVRKVINF